MKTVHLSIKLCLAGLLVLLFAVQGNAQTVQEKSNIIRIPMLPAQSHVSPGKSMTVYTFSGVGIWSDKKNWEGGLVPPAVLSASDKVIMQGTCLLDNNTIQQVLKGARVEVRVEGKANIMLKDILLQQKITASSKNALVMAGKTKGATMATKKAITAPSLSGTQGKKAMTVVENSATQ